MVWQVQNYEGSVEPAVTVTDPFVLFDPETLRDAYESLCCDGIEMPRRGDVVQHSTTRPSRGN